MLKKRSIYRILVLWTIFVLSSCSYIERPTSGKPAPQPTVEHFQPVFLPVSRVDVQNQSMKANAVDGFIISPVNAIEGYARKRFKSQGGYNGLKFIIKKADLNYELLEQENHVVRWAGFGREDQYTLGVEIMIDLENIAATSLSFERTLVIANSASLAEREAKQVRFIEDLIHDLDEAVLGVLRQYQLIN